MLGFQPLSSAPISVLAAPFVSQPVVDQPIPVLFSLSGGDDAWTEPAKDLLAEYAKDKKSRSDRLIEAWEYKYEPKPPKTKPAQETVAEQPTIDLPEADPEPVITSLEPFVFPAINISDEEIQLVTQLLLESRKAAWMQRMNKIKMRLTKISEEQNAHLLSNLQQPKLH